MNKINRKIVLSAVILLITAAVALTACRGKNKDKTSSDTKYNDIESTESLTSKEASEVTSEWNGNFDSPTSANSADNAKESGGKKKTENPSSAVSNQESGSMSSSATDNSSKENTSSDSKTPEEGGLGAEITTEPNGFVG